MMLNMKYLGITNLATTVTLATIENKIPNVIDLVKKLTIRQKLMKLEKITLIMIIIISILLHKNLIS